MANKDQEVQDFIKGLDGKWVDLRASAEANPEIAALLEKMQGDLLIILAERLGGDVRIPLPVLDEQPRGKVAHLYFDGTTYRVVVGSTQ